MMKKVFSVTVLCLLLVSVLLFVGFTNSNDTPTTTITTTNLVPDTKPPQGEPHMALDSGYWRG